MENKGRWHWIKYPKIFLLILSFVTAYFIFENFEGIIFFKTLQSAGLLGVFVVGMFFTFGFTSAPATAMLLLMAKSQPIFLAAFVGGVGALIGDLLIFSIFRYSMMDEIKRLEKERFVKNLQADIPNRLKHYLLPVLASFAIASPLPDEIGVVMFASFTKIHPAVFSVLSFLLNTLGIFVLLVVGKAI